jgi:predicted MPP superfamily phosphohydrolase
MPRVPEHVSLTLAGHTYGGQVRLPPAVAVVTIKGNE